MKRSLIAALVLAGCQPVGGGQQFPGTITHSIVNVVTWGNTPTLTPTTTLTIPVSAAGGGLGGLAPLAPADGTLTPPYGVCGSCSITEGASATPATSPTPSGFSPARTRRKPIALNPAWPANVDFMVAR